MENSGQTNHRPGEFILEKFQIVFGNYSKTADIRALFLELNIFEDMFSNIITGEVVISDSINLISSPTTGQDTGKLTTPGIVGNEKLEISLFTKNIDPLTGDSEDKRIEYKFRIFKISSRSLTTERNQVYILHFTSEMEVVNQNTKVCRSFQNKTVSEVVKLIYKDYLKKDELDNLILEDETDDVFSVVIPYWQPFDAINWLSVRGYSQKYKGATYVFFQSLHGDKDKTGCHYFTSLEKIFQEEPIRTIIFQPANIDDPGTSNYAVNKYLIEDSFDTLENAMNGMYANRILTFDIVTKKTQQIDKKYVEEFSKSYHLENSKLCVEEFNSGSNKGDNGWPSAFVKYFSKNDYLYSQSKDDSRQGDKNSYDTKVEKWAQPRIMNFQALNNIRLKIAMPGDFKFRVGKLVKFDIPSPEPFKDGDPIIDRLLSGKFLITRIKHRILPSKYEVDMEIVKESLKEDPGAYDN